MTVKDTLVEALRRNGFDFVTACEEAEIAIQEFKDSGQKKQKFSLRNGETLILHNSKATGKRARKW